MRDWTAYDEAYDEARNDRWQDDPEADIHPRDELSDEEKAEDAAYWRQFSRRRRRG